MKSFKEFIFENNKVQFQSDNPGGEWLKKKKQIADNQMERYKNDKESPTGRGIGGPITGYFTHHLKIPVKHLKHINGAMGEENHRNDFNNPKHIKLSKLINDNGFDTKKHPIQIGVNHKGDAYIVNGNHRLAHAIKNNHSHIHAEVKYYNGGEEIENKNFHPNNLLKHHKEANG